MNKRYGFYATRLIWWLLVLFLCLVVIYPIITLVLSSFKTEAGYSLSNYINLFLDAGIKRSMLNSMLVVVPSTVFSTGIGVFLAFLLVRTDLPFKGLLKNLLTIPYFIPPFIGAIAWVFLLGPSGYFNVALMKLFGLSDPVFNIYSIGGMIFVMTIYRFSVPFIVVMPTMEKINSSMEEAARISGATSFRTMLDITLPLLRPSILGSTLLVFMFLLADFGVASVLGAPNRIRVMTTEIYSIVTRPDLPNHLEIAAAYSMILSILAIVGLIIYNRILVKNKYAVISGKSAPTTPIKLTGIKKWGLFVLVVIFFGLSTLSPIVATGITAVTKVWGVPFSFSNMTFSNFSKLFLVKNIGRAFRNSFVLAGLSAVIITVVTLVIAYLVIRKNVRGVFFVRLMEIMVTLPYALPGTVIALSMILTFAKPLPFTGIVLYQTFAILLIAYVARFLNLGYNNIAGAISQIDPSLEEQARVSGANQFRSFKDIVLPLLKDSLIGSMFLVIAPTLTEISLSSLLYSTGNETIGTVVYASQEEGKILRTASLAIVLIVLVTVISFISRKINGKVKDI